jgi:hypothetical protein
MIPTMSFSCALLLLLMQQADLESELLGLTEIDQTSIGQPIAWIVMVIFEQMMTTGSFRSCSRRIVVLTAIKTLEYSYKSPHRLKEYYASCCILSAARHTLTCLDSQSSSEVVPQSPRQSLPQVCALSMLRHLSSGRVDWRHQLALLCLSPRRSHRRRYQQAEWRD